MYWRNFEKVTAADQLGVGKVVGCSHGGTPRPASGIRAVKLTKNKFTFYGVGPDAERGHRQRCRVFGKLGDRIARRAQANGNVALAVCYKPFANERHEGILLLRGVAGTLEAGELLRSQTANHTFSLHPKAVSWILHYRPLLDGPAGMAGAKQNSQRHRRQHLCAGAANDS